MFDHPTGNVSPMRLLRVTEAACAAIAVASLIVSAATYATSSHTAHSSPAHTQKAPAVAKGATPTNP